MIADQAVVLNNNRGIDDRVPADFGVCMYDRTSHDVRALFSGGRPADDGTAMLEAFDGKATLHRALEERLT